MLNHRSRYFHLLSHWSPKKNYSLVNSFIDMVINVNRSIFLFKKYFFEEKTTSELSLRVRLYLDQKNSSLLTRTFTNFWPIMYNNHYTFFVYYLLVRLGFIRIYCKYICIGFSNSVKTCAEQVKCPCLCSDIGRSMT